MPVPRVSSLHSGAAKEGNVRLPHRITPALAWLLALAILPAGSHLTSLTAIAMPARQKIVPMPIQGDEPGFQPIFDGRTLSGWEGDFRYWRAEAGAIVGEITAATLIQSNTFIIWRGGRPRDFELKLDYRITPVGNSGINYRSAAVPDPVTPSNQFALRGYQFDLDGAKLFDGNIHEEKGRQFLSVRGQLTHVPPDGPPVVLSTLGAPTELAALITGDWNAAHLIVRGNTLMHLLNGRLMSVAIDDDVAHRPIDGVIGLQVHAGPPMRVEYRDIRIKTRETAGVPLAPQNLRIIKGIAD